MSNQIWVQEGYNLLGDVWAEEVCLDVSAAAFSLVVFDRLGKSCSPSFGKIEA